MQGWRRYEEQEPFGEIRSDERQAANTIWAKSIDAGAAELPDLTYPYFDTDQDLTERIKALDGKIAEGRHGS